MMRWWVVGLLLFNLGLVSCQSSLKLLPPVHQEPAPVWLKLDPNRLQLRDQDTTASLLRALDQSLSYLSNATNLPDFSFGEATYSKQELIASLCLLKQMIHQSKSQSELFADLKRDFDFYYPSALLETPLKATGYYTPLIYGSFRKSPRYSVPVYALPENLEVLKLGDFRSSLKNRTIVFHRQGNRIVPYPSYKEIDQKKIPAKVLAYVDSKVDLAFVQIQGSGYMEDENGQFYSLSYAGSNGRDYISLGNFLVKNNYLSREEVSMQSIRAFLTANPDKINDTLYSNLSYVFFNLTPGKAPIRGSLNVALTKERSAALDSALFPPALPFFLYSTIAKCDFIGLCNDATVAFNKILFHQDSGGAIKGYSRIDIYFGEGLYAEAVAGRLAAKAEMLFFVAKKDRLAKIEKLEGCFPLQVVN